MDGNMARPTIQPSRRRRLSGELADRSLFMVNAPEMDLAIEVPASDGRMRFWRNTSIATLAGGETATLPNGTLSYKWDVDLENGFRPAGLVPVSTTVHRFTNELLARLRKHVRSRDWYTSHGVVPSWEWIARIRRRHHSVALGTRCQPR